MSVKKRGKRWHADFSIRGKRRRASIPEATNREQAVRAETRMREEVYNQRYNPEQKRIEFRQFVETEYLPSAEKRSRNFSSNIGYQSRKLVERFGSRMMHEMTQVEIEKWLLEQEEMYSGSTVNRMVERLKVIFKQAIAAGYIDADRNPMRLIGKVEENPRAKRRLSRDEETAIINSAKELGFEYVGSATIILLETGMRPQEFLMMKKDQVCLQDGTINVISYKIGWRRASAPQPKNRIIPLTERAWAEFEHLMRETPGDFVFPYRSIKNSWATVLKTAGVENFWFRWLRDEAASRWNDVGLDQFTIAKLLGHASPRTSMIYVKSWARDVLAKLNGSEKSQCETSDHIEQILRTAQSLPPAERQRLAGLLAAPTLPQ